MSSVLVEILHFGSSTWPRDGTFIHRSRVRLNNALFASQARMMNDGILADVAKDGHLTRMTRLIERGHSRAHIRGAIATGRLLQICAGWIGTPRASQLAVIAVANYGKLTAATALAMDGIWDADDRRIHVVVRPNAHGTSRSLRVPIASFTAPRFAATGFDRHWARERCADATAPPWRVSTIDALAQVCRDAPPEQFIACVESAIHNRAVASRDLDTLFAALPEDRAYLRHWIDPLAESGLETIARIRIRRFVALVEPQVEIRGINPFGRPGRVDLLLDGWLVVELDGDQFHDPVVDRARNSALVKLGYRYHRFGHSQVLRQWAECERIIREMLSTPPLRLPAR